MERQRSTWSNGSLAAVYLTFLVLTVVLPLAVLMLSAQAGQDDGAQPWRALLLDAPVQQAVLRTLSVALLATGLASLIAIPAAFAAVRAIPPLRQLILACGVLPLTMPPFVTASLFQQWPGDRLQAIPLLERLPLDLPTILLTLSYAVHFVPVVMLGMVAGLNRIDRSLVESARIHGAGSLQTWRQITLPLLTAPFVLGAVIVVLRIFEDIASPLVLRIDGMLAPQIYRQFTSDGTDQSALQLGVLLFGLSAVLVVVAWSSLLPRSAITPRRQHAMPLRWSRGIGNWLYSGTLLVLVAGVALAPHAWMLSRLGPPPDIAQWLAGIQPALANTLPVATASGLLLLMLGLTVDRLSRRRTMSGALVRGATATLFAVPGVVLALAWRQSAGQLPGLTEAITSWPGLVLALLVSIKLLPYLAHLIPATRIGLAPAQTDLARCFGASRFGVMMYLVFPLLATLMAGLVLLGVAAGVAEISGALVLLSATEPTLAMAAFDRAVSLPQIISLQAIALTALLGLLLIPALLLLQTRTKRPHRHRRNRPATTEEPS